MMMTQVVQPNDFLFIIKRTLLSGSDKPKESSYIVACYYILHFIAVCKTILVDVDRF